MTSPRPRVELTDDEWRAKLTPDEFAGSPPYMARFWRDPLLASLTQSGHWKPTAASRMQSGQIGLSQRWQRIQVSRSGCR